MVGYVVCAVFVPEGLQSCRTGVSVHLNGFAFNCLLCFNKKQYESKVVSIVQYYFSRKEDKDLELMDMSNEELNDEDSVLFVKKGSINCKINNFYGYSNCDDSMLPNIITDKVSFFDVIKTDKYEILAGDIVVLSKRSSCDFVFCGVLKVAANRRSRLPKYYNLVMHSSEKNKIFSFLLCHFEKKINKSKFVFEKSHITLLQSTADKFTKRGFDTKIPHYTQLGNYLVNIYVLNNRIYIKNIISSITSKT